MSKIFKKWRTKRLVHAIKKADDVQCAQILCAVIQRYRSRYPDVEPVFVNLPRKDPGECKRILDLLRQTI